MTSRVEVEAASAGRPVARGGEVQSVERAMSLLGLLADATGPLSLSELAAAAGLTQPTAHRLLKTLCAGGHVRQLPDRRYALGARLIGWGQSAVQSVHHWARPHLARLVDEVGETANMAVLDGDELVYVAQVPSRYSMRMFTEVGRRVSPHCTGVGKAVLAAMPAERAERAAAVLDYRVHTPHTVASPEQLLAAVERARQDGYALDDGEQELGVRCIAVALPLGGSWAAVSVSGPSARLDDERVRAVAPAVAETARRVAAELLSPS